MHHVKVFTVCESLENPPFSWVFAVSTASKHPNDTAGHVIIPFHTLPNLIWRDFLSEALYESISFCDFIIFFFPMVNSEQGGKQKKIKPSAVFSSHCCSQNFTPLKDLFLSSCSYLTWFLYLDCFTFASAACSSGHFACAFSNWRGETGGAPGCAGTSLVQFLCNPFVFAVWT